jgi:hypothetical protein
MSGFNIQDFKSNIANYDVLQNNKFWVTVPLPRDVVEDYGSNPSNIISEDYDLRFRAHQINLPGLSFETNVVNRYGVGPYQKFPTNINLPNVNINFLETKNGNIYKRISAWMQYIFNKSMDKNAGLASYDLAYKYDYSRDAIINVFNNEDALAAITIYLYDAFPIAINDIFLNWESKNSLINISTTFAFSDFAIYRNN